MTTPYEQLGGDSGVRALVERFYDLMDLEPAFAGLSIDVDAIEHQVVRLVKTSGAMDRVIISSFDKRILQRIAAMDAPPAGRYTW